MTRRIEELRKSVIELASRTDDVEKLDRAYRDLSMQRPKLTKAERDARLAEAAVEVGPAPSLEEIVARQKRTPLDFMAFSQRVEKINAEEDDPSLQEMLDALD